MSKSSGGTRSNNGSVGAKLKNGVVILKKRPRWNRIYKEIESVLEDIASHDFNFTTTKKLISIGDVDYDMQRYADENGIFIATEKEYITSSQILHASRKIHREEGLYVGDEELKNFPRNRRKMDLYYDTDKKNFIYTDYINKYIVHPGKVIKTHEKGVQRTYFITGMKLKPGNNEFTMSNHVRVRP